ncbi:hypothetical protein JKP88DRAFT_254539 [Tribonema minus]|uniref:Uncharacterized protein n=1 Tax=Tribonema minus TaxID=303371 RepID=A0A836CIJ2_9STRA|nr:hypothetical protein JKP88DRAFT_254539 [Tribonema minus]
MVDGSVGAVAFDALEIPDLTTDAPGSAAVTIVCISDSQSYFSLIDISPLRRRSSLMVAGPQAAGGLSRHTVRYYIHGRQPGTRYHAVMSTSTKARDSAHKQESAAALNANFAGGVASASTGRLQGSHLRLKSPVPLMAICEQHGSMHSESAGKAMNGLSHDAHYGCLFHRSFVAEQLMALARAKRFMKVMPAVGESEVIVLNATAQNKLRRQLSSLDYVEKATDDLLDHTSTAAAIKHTVRDLRKPLVAAKLRLEETDWSDAATTHSFINWSRQRHVDNANTFASDETIKELTLWIDHKRQYNMIHNIALTTNKQAAPEQGRPSIGINKSLMADASEVCVMMPQGGVVCGMFGSVPLSKGLHRTDAPDF